MYDRRFYLNVMNGVVSMKHFEKTVKKNNVFSGRIFSIDVHEVVLENGKHAEREILSHPGGVSVIPVTEEGEIYFVKQFRKPYECEVLEIPAGKLEKGEEPERCAARELREETGLRAAKLTYLTQMYPSPGYTDEIIHIYKAEGLEQGEVSPDEDEFVDICKLSIEDAVAMVKSGEIKDAKTVIAILLVSL